MKKPLFLTLVCVLSIGLYAANNKKPDERELVAQNMPKIEAPTKKYQVLCFSKPYGFRHDSIPTGKTMMEVMAEKTGLFEVTFSDDLTEFAPDKIKKYDAICLNNNTHIQNGMKDEKMRETFINYVKQGGGIFAIHSATDGGWPEYVEMIGGNFDGHPWGAGGTWGVANEDPNHPIVRNVYGGENFTIKDEIYQYKDFDRAKNRVLLTLDLTHEATGKKKGKRADKDYAIAWLKKYGEGRVFVSSLGHNKEVFYNPEILKMWVEGFRFVLGEADFDTASVPKPEAE
ncbi:ThuA domain-containing protein [Akkermansiaceae bacterium]|nr:ThuA domain-containing protein [Akkermansiaceae bacterium]MDB4537859.1 ThuA domain-containing protein [Akkermansiaceae bacterium]